MSSSSGFSSSSSMASMNINRPNNRIASKLNLALASMPSFMKQGQEDKMRRFTTKQQRRDSPEERTPSPIHRRADSNSSILNPIFRSRTYVKRLDFNPGILDEYEDYIDSIRSEEKTKPIMRISSFTLTAQDFGSLLEPGPLTRTALDVCLTMLKKLNYQILLRDGGHKKIVIASTAFAWKIFNEGNFENLHAPSYVFSNK